MAIQKVFSPFVFLICLCFISSFSMAEERPISINFWPIFQYISDPMEGTQEIEGLGPFFYWKKDPYQGQWGIRPLLYWTGDEKESLWRWEYIYRFLLDRYGKDEIRFYLWPLYGESTSEGVHTTNLLWPFFSFIKGEKKRGGRFWPFYGRKEEFGVSKSEFFLWPIFLKQTKEIDTDNPVNEWMVFPFYIAKESKHFESKTFLWPFFSH